MIKNPARTILALDPGLQDFGYAVFRGKTLTAWNVISLRRVQRSRRMPAARSAIRELVRQHRPTELVVENTHRYPNGLHNLVPVLKRLAREHRMKLHFYSHQAVRKHLLGDGWATKAEAASAMAIRYPLLKVHLGQTRKWKERYWFNMFDAVALATHHRLAD